MGIQADVVNEMVERVARAMFNDDEAHSDSWGWDQHPPRDWDADQIEDCERGTYRRNARAAIEAMREPTEAMIRAGEDGFSPAGTYGMMIDEALKTETAESGS